MAARSELGSAPPLSSEWSLIRFIRAARRSLAIRGEIISAYPRRAFGKRDRRAKGPRTDRA